MRFLAFLALSLLATGCGASYDTVKVKEYRLSLVKGEPGMATEFRRLVDDFNAFAQMKVLSYVSDADDANSAIILTKGLKARDGKVGWGQWLSQAESENPYTKAPGQHPKRTVHFSMRLEFDQDYFDERVGDDDPKKRYEKQKLFFHEVGHGLEMDHNENDKNDVMYPDITGDKDFPAFFQKVRAYMRDA